MYMNKNIAGFRASKSVSPGTESHQEELLCAAFDSQICPGFVVELLRLREFGLAHLRQTISIIKGTTVLLLNLIARPLGRLLLVSVVVVGRVFETKFVSNFCLRR